MDDLVRRLCSGHTHNGQTWSDMCHEAAEEIERLRENGRKADEAIAFASDQIAEATAECQRLRAELLEQARIIGISGERELALRAEVERLERWKAGLTEIVERSTREARGGPQFPEVHRVRLVWRTEWAEAMTPEWAEQRLRAALKETSHDRS